MPEKKKVLDLSNPDPYEIGGVKRPVRKKKQSSSRIVQILMGIILFLIIIVAGYWTFQHFNSSKSTPSQSAFEQKNSAH